MCIHQPRSISVAIGDLFCENLFNFATHAERSFTLEMFAVETKLLIVLKLMQ